VLVVRPVTSFRSKMAISQAFRRGRWATGLGHDTHPTLPEKDPQMRVSVGYDVNASVAAVPDGYTSFAVAP
jgi:hypothetical protein